MYLKPTNKKLRSIFYAILLIVGAYFVGERLAFALNTGMKKTVVFLFLLSALLMVPYLYKKMGTSIFVKGLFFLFWLPIPIVLNRYAPFRDLYFYEFGVWALVGFIFINNAIYSDPRLRITIKRFPFLPFLIYIGGAFTTYLLTNSSLYDFAHIRFVCILPLLICFLACYTITTVEDAENLLWIILTAAAILGIVILFGEKYFGFVRATQYAMDTGPGRLSAYIAIPFLGILKINPEIGAEIFAFIGVISFQFWINSYSFYSGARALIILIVSITVIIMCQGRGAMIAFLCSAVAMAILNYLITKGRKKFFIILKMGTIVSSTLSVYLFMAYTSSYDYFHEHGTILFTDPTNDPNLLNRIAFWQDGIETIFLHPFGVGLHGYDLEPFSSSTWIVHNLYLWLMLSFGLFGLLGFIWIIYTCFKILLFGFHSKKTDLKMLCIGGIGVLITLLLIGIISPIFNSPHIVVAVWSPIAIIMAAVLSKDDKDKK